MSETWPKFILESLPETVYHGTIASNISEIANGIDFSTCKSLTDFGRGFYLTTNYEQAKRWAFRKERINNIKEIKKQYRGDYNINLSQGIVFEYKFNKSFAYGLNNHVFAEPDLEWAEFIYRNRTEEFVYPKDFHNKDSRYDFVYGPVADGRIGLLIGDVDDGTINMQQFHKEITNPQFWEDDQLSIHTTSALRCLQLKGVKPIHEYPARAKTTV